MREREHGTVTTGGRKRARYKERYGRERIGWKGYSTSIKGSKRRQERSR